MHMTLEADYAVRIVEFLAVNPGRADAKTISERTSVTLRFTLKILRTLVSDGIVRRAWWGRIRAHRVSLCLKRRVCRPGCSG